MSRRSLRWHPIAIDEVLAWWNTADVEPWVMVDAAGDLVGYGEIWVDAEEDEVELARLIVPRGVAWSWAGQGAGAVAAADGCREGYDDDVPAGGA